MDPKKNPMRKIPTHLVRSSLGGADATPGDDVSGVKELLHSLNGDSAQHLKRRKTPIDFSKFITIPAKFVRDASQLFSDVAETFSKMLGVPQGDLDNQTPMVGTGPTDNRKIHDYLAKKSVQGSSNLPSYYNVREQYPQCNSQVLDQDLCGSCWGFATAGMLGDRLCMRTNGKFNQTLSPQDMIDCDYENFGCQGGYIVQSIDFLTTDGVSSIACSPYTQET